MGAESREHSPGWHEVFPDTRWRVERKLSESLHSLNNEVTVLTDEATGERFVARRPNGRTADALGIRRTKEAIALRAAGLHPAPRAMTPDGLLLTPFIESAGAWTGSRWTGSHAAKGYDLVRRLLGCPAPEGVPSTVERLGRMLDSVGDPGRFGIERGQIQTTLAEIGAERAEDDRYERSLAHHDLWANNIIDHGDRLWLVDFEFAGGADGWFDLATVVAEGGFDERGTVDFLRAVGRSGDSEDLRALRQGTWLFHVFEMLWGAIIAERREDRRLGGERFDYAGHARRIACDLAGLQQNV